MKMQDIMAETNVILRAYAETGFYADFDSPRALYGGMIGMPTYLRRGDRRVVIWCESENDSSECDATRSGTIYYHKVTYKVADFTVTDEKRYRHFDACPNFWAKHAYIEKTYYQIGEDWYTEDFQELVRCRGIAADRAAARGIRITEYRKMTIPLLRVARKLKGFKTAPMENISVECKPIHGRITLGEPIRYRFKNRKTGTTAFVCGW